MDFLCSDPVKNDFYSLDRNSVQFDFTSDENIKNSRSNVMLDTVNSFV